MAGQVIGIASRILTKSGGFEGLGFVVESFLVQQVAENSPAARLGLRPEGIKSQIGSNEMFLGGDIILEVVGIEVLNGVPSLSVLDSWWIEGCIEGVTGWSIGEKGSSDWSKDAASLF